MNGQLATKLEERVESMKFRIAVSAVCILGLAVVLNVQAEEEKKVDFSKIKCVVSGKAVKEDATADYKTGKVYFCCPGCPSAFAKDKAKFAAKANHQLVATKQAKQEKCPMSGGKVKDGTEVKVAGVEVKFCCNNCQGKAKGAEGAKQVELIFNEKSFKKGFKLAKAEETESAAATN